MRVSQFGGKFLHESGALQLMEDLGQALRQPGMIMLGGGNPSRIPVMEEYFAAAMGKLLESGEFAELVGVYDAPGGHRAFIEAVAALLCERCGWPVGPENIALTNGSQTAFFFLFNLLAGDLGDGRQARILLPVMPEYIGYTDAGITPDLFIANRPRIEFLERRFFKYRVDFDALHVDESIQAICVSRPTNPTGNVLDAGEMARLNALAAAHDIPFIVDNAYGAPFPNILYNDDHLTWTPQMILCLSLSKLGMPGARTGIVVASPPIVHALTAMNATISLTPNALGPRLALELVRSGEILALSRDVIRPHYAAKATHAVAALEDALDGLDFLIHKPEGAFFLWLWFRELPISSRTLYERLKTRGVLVIPGHHFFPGLTGEWQHRHECIRLNYAGDSASVARGAAIIADEVRRAYSG
jgi:valine--pyruvate aminotransferase